MNIKSPRPGEAASALVIALVMAAVLASLGAATFIAINDKYRVVHQAASWEEALESAEAGVEIGLSEVRQQLLGITPFKADDDWEAIGDGGNYKGLKRKILRSGEGGNESWTIITCDIPFRSSTGEAWYRIRAHGYCRVPGGRISAGSSLDSNLRKLSLRYDRYSQSALAADAVFKVSDELATGPIAHRAIEAIVRPVSAFEMAMFGDDGINFTDHLIYLDSFDSEDPAKSYWAPGATFGVYDPTKHTSYADIGTNGEVINVKDATVYGTANTDGGTVLNNDNVQGHPGDPVKIRDDFSMSVGEVIAPSTTEEPTSTAYASYTQASDIPGDSNYDHVIQAGDGATTVVRLSALDLSSKSLFIQGVSGKTTDAHIIVTGNINITGQGYIKLDTGVRVRIFVAGDVKIAGNAVVNNGPALNFQLYGTDSDSSGNATIRNMDVNGNGQFTGAIYAPNYNIKLDGGGSSGNFIGAVVGNYVTMTGNTQFHYDEALGRGGLVAAYKIASWFEDER